MGRPRKFDWDEARRLRAEGLTYREIGERLGVSHHAVNCACDAAVRMRKRADTKRRLEASRVPCRGGCGVLVWMQGGRSGYCLSCLGERRRVVRHGTENEYRQGCRCEPCRLAASEAKRRRREQSRVPCSHGCGTLVDSINRRSPDKPPECRPCALRRIHAERRAKAAV